MQLTREQAKDSHIISAYDKHSITINEKKYEESLVVHKKTVAPWTIESIARIKAEDFEPIILLRPTIVLIGTGEKHRHLEPKLLAVFYKKNIGVEIMATASACKTYNLLTIDGRNVAAAIYQN